MKDLEELSMEFSIYKKIYSLLTKEIEKEKKKYIDIIMDDAILNSIKNLHSFPLKDFVMNYDKYKKKNQIYRIDFENKKSKNDYILISNEYIFPFLLKEKIEAPDKKSPEYEILLEKYNTYKPKSKKEILDFFYNETKNDKLFTKKELNEKTFSEIKEKLDSKNIDLANIFLNVFDIENKISIRTKKIEEDLLKTNVYFTMFTKIKDSDKNVDNKLYAYNNLLKEIKKIIEKDEKIIKKELQEEEKNNQKILLDNDFIKISLFESFSLKTDNITEDKYLLDAFFQKSFDNSAYKKAINKGEEEIFEKKDTIIFYSPCKNISEFLHRQNIKDFIINSIDNSTNYSRGDQINFF